MQIKAFMGKNLIVISHVSQLKTGPINVVTDRASSLVQLLNLSRSDAGSVQPITEQCLPFFCHKSVTYQPITGEQRGHFLL